MKTPWYYSNCVKKLKPTWIVRAFPKDWESKQKYFEYSGSFRNYNLEKELDLFFSKGIVCDVQFSNGAANFQYICE
jgi:hypothetical protein